jgi:catechol 2,3-dioxygenase-like lactoylglutathione lyase family enzyme
MRLYMVEICVRNWPGTRDWYRDTLGLDLVFSDEPHRFTMFRAGGMHLALKGGTPKDSERDGFNLAFEVGDVDDIRAQLIARGIAVGEPFDSPYQEGYREARLSDPEGTHIRLFSWLKEQAKA